MEVSGVSAVIIAGLAWTVVTATGMVDVSGSMVPVTTAGVVHTVVILVVHMVVAAGAVVTAGLAGVVATAVVEVAATVMVSEAPSKSIIMER